MTYFKKKHILFIYILFFFIIVSQVFAVNSAWDRLPYSAVKRLKRVSLGVACATGGFCIVCIATLTCSAGMAEFSIGIIEKGVSNICSGLRPKFFHPPEVMSECPESDCIICLESLSNEEMSVQTECDHYFHKKCLEEWKKVRPNCPICRGNGGIEHSFLIVPAQELELNP